MPAQVQSQIDHAPLTNARTAPPVMRLRLPSMAVHALVGFMERIAISNRPIQEAVSLTRALTVARVSLWAALVHTFVYVQVNNLKLNLKINYIIH